MNENIKELKSELREVLSKFPAEEYSDALHTTLECIEKQDCGLNDDCLLKYAVNEFDQAVPGWRNSELQYRIFQDILNILRVFSVQGHSGASASYLIPRLRSLMMFEPLTKLKFTDDEFIGSTDDEFIGSTDDEFIDRQNKRLSSVFKERNGRFKYLYAFIKEETLRIIIDPFTHDITEFSKPENPSRFSGSFPIVCMNDGSFAKVTAVYIKDPKTFDWNKKHNVKSIYVGSDGWESFTVEEEMRKVEQDYDITYKIFENPEWKDLDENWNSSRYSSDLLFGSFNKLADKIKPYLNYLKE